MATTRPAAHGSQGYVDTHTFAAPAPMGGHDDPYTGGTSYPPAGAGMDGYHQAPVQGTPVKVTTREREYSGPGVASTGVPSGLGMPVSTMPAQQSLASDGQYNLRAK